MQSNKILFTALIAAFLLLTALPARAGILPACATDVNAVLQLSCFLTLLVGVSQWILGITGSLALLFFVYGGFMMMTSKGAGTAEWGLEKSKNILTQAVIGIIIIFGAYLTINFLVATVLKAKFTTEIPKEAVPAQQAPTQQVCSCYCQNIAPDGSIMEPLLENIESPSEAACKKTCESKPALKSKDTKQIFNKCIKPGTGSGAVKDSTPKCNCICSDTAGVEQFDAGIKSSLSECRQTCQLKSRLYDSCNEIK